MVPDDASGRKSCVSLRPGAEAAWWCVTRASQVLRPRSAVSTRGLGL